MFEMSVGCGGRSEESRLPCAEQNAAQFQFVLADAIAQKAELANADESRRQHVQQKAAEELDRVQGERLGPAAIGIILRGEADSAVCERLQTVVGNGNAMRVAGEILEHACGSTKGRLGIYDPCDAYASYSE